MKRYILLTEKSWHDQLYETIKGRINAEWKRICRREDFTVQFVEEFKPDYIFIPHWSYIIPKEIHSSFSCVVFHMTDLPYGRGGSPLQNLISRGVENTKISALKVDEGIDTGDIFLKRDLNLNGTAEEIFIRAAKVIEEMIVEIAENQPTPKLQQGRAVTFKRRGALDSDIHSLERLEDVYNFIRMLDCDGYPKAYLETPKLKFEFSRASLKADKSIIADVRITAK